MPNQIVRLRSRILLPLGLGFCVILVLGFSGTYLIQQRALDLNISHRIANSRVLFKELLKVEAEILGSLTGNYGEIKELQTTFLAGDRDKLLTMSLPLFNEIKAHNKITHFYFHRLNKTCFLRVHTPNRYDDKISRFTLDQAIRLEAPAYGIELGPLGTLTFRLVQPWRVNGKLIGYIELGKEIDRITPTFKHILNLGLLFTVQKKHLDRKLWTEGEAMLNKPENWDQFRDFVVVSSTFSQISPELGQDISRHFASHDMKLFNTTQENRIYRGGAIPLIDAAGQEIGDIFVFADYSNITSSRNLFIILIMLSTLTLAVFYTLFTFHIARIERDLQLSMDALGNEVAWQQESARQGPEAVEGNAAVQELRNFLPSCAGCKKVRTPAGTWEPLESYLREHSEAESGVNYCPECTRKFHSEPQKGYPAG
ncbi:MAG: hypothetical protein HGA96_04175 [Desulfobulbaceae bacterium]|nr:hypothetical protein [Desulfobulbaceae bacterium]